MRFRFLNIVVLGLALTAAAPVGSFLLDQRPASPAPATPASGTQAGAASEVLSPVGKDSVRFAVIGDSGTGDKAQYAVAAQLVRSIQVFPYEFVIMLGDNIYGSERPQDFAKKFELPYKALLDAKIPFYASLGNHDDPNQRYYKPFNMGGQRFYAFQKNDVRFFVLDSNYMDKDQQAWLEKELPASNSKWKIVYFHHPLYSSGNTHGSEVDLRTIIEPLFIKHGVSVVFAGHEHFYERIKPQKGISYFTSGGAAKLRDGDIRNIGLTAKGFDTEQSYMLIEIDGDVMHYQAVSRRGKLVDSGDITRITREGTQ